MAIIQSGASGSTLMTVDASRLAGRMSLQPYEQTVHYSVTAATGTIATSTAANGQLFTMRWAPGTGALCLIDKITISVNQVAAFVTTGQAVGIAARILRGTTAVGSGGTQITVAGNSQKYRTSMATSGFTAGTSDIRVAGTSALTSASGGTLDTNPLAVVAGPGILTTAYVGIIPPGTVLTDSTNGRYPIVLTNTDVLVIENNVLLSNTGTYQLFVNVEWSEAASY
jgi:hypothetical protein